MLFRSKSAAKALMRVAAWIYRASQGDGRVIPTVVAISACELEEVGDGQAKAV